MEPTRKSFVFRSDEMDVRREREFTLVKAGKVLMVNPKEFRALPVRLHNFQRLIYECRTRPTVQNQAHYLGSRTAK